MSGVGVSLSLYFLTREAEIILGPVIPAASAILEHFTLQGMPFSWVRVWATF